MGLEDNTACCGQEKKLWVNIAICLVSTPPSICLITTESSTPFERIKRRIYSNKEVLFFLHPSSRYTTYASNYSLSNYRQPGLVNLYMATNLREEKLWTQTSLKIDLMSPETCSRYLRSVKALERFHQACLRNILNIKCWSQTPDNPILQRANTSRIEMLLIYNQMHWAGNFTKTLGYPGSCSTKSCNKVDLQDMNIRNFLRMP